MNDYMKILGLKGRDKVTDLEGIVTSVSFDLYGCVQVVLDPGLKKDGSKSDSYWLDFKRIEILSRKPIMPVPSYGSPGSEIGAAEKPPR